MAWSIDRLGRSLIDLLNTVQNLEAYGVDLYLDQRNIDTTTPAGKLMFQIIGAFAEFERSMIRQRVKLGIKRAVAQGKHLGRPAIAPELERKAQRQLRKGTGILKVAKLVGLGTGTVHRIKREIEACVCELQHTTQWRIDLLCRFSLDCDPSPMAGSF